MTLTEKILAKIVAIHNDGTDWGAERNKQYKSMLLFEVALRRQVEKHTEISIGCGIHTCCPPGIWECAVCEEDEYPCTFIKEVATDLGIEVGL